MDRKMVNFIKEQYPPGTRIRLNSMEDPYHPILPGTEGEVDFVDDKGQIFMKWDNGRTLPLAPGKDSFTVLPPKLTTLKLYMLHHMSGIFEDNSKVDQIHRGLQIDRKRRQELQRKRLAMGHKPDDHEEQIFR